MNIRGSFGVARGVSPLFVAFGLFLLVLLMPGFASAAPTAYTQIPDYQSRGTFVQGACASDDGRYVYVAKQRLSQYANLQRIDLKKKRSKRLSVSGGVRPISLMRMV